MKLTAFVLLAMAGAGAPTPAHAPAPFTLDSPAFAAGAPIPVEHTADGSDVSPPLHWTGAPAGTKSFALVVDDPDAPDPAAPKMVWSHWVLYNLPADATALAKGAKGAALPKGVLEGTNDWNAPGWRGPSPPIGTHRYFFRLYALDTKLADLHHPNKARLLDTLKGHVLGTAELMGTYRKH